MVYYDCTEMVVFITVMYFRLATVEDQNFALFNYVNELNGEIEMVLKQIEQVSNTLHTHFIGSPD